MSSTLAGEMQRSSNLILQLRLKSANRTDLRSAMFIRVVAIGKRSLGQRNVNVRSTDFRKKY